MPTTPDVAAAGREWSPDSWRSHRALQQPSYENPRRYQDVLRRIGRLPPLVFPGEVEALKSQLAEAGQGRRFVLQGGDCVERFADCNAEAIKNKLKILLQMSVILTHAARRPVVRVGRMAGQYAKPRSAATERVGELTLPVYRGDSINDHRPRPKARRSDPSRLLQGYHYSTATLNYIRAMINGGFADLHRPYTWNLHAIERTEEWDEYRGIVEQILDAIHFMESFGGLNQDRLGGVECFTSHEGLHLGYEQALTRRDEASGRFYNLGAHMLWIGERTRDPEGAHVEYFRGIANPVAVKLGPTADARELGGLLEALNPGNEMGRLTLVTRLGRGRPADLLPPLIRAVRAAGAQVLWSCDPMHGNTVLTREAIKTRSFEDILAEVQETFEAHRGEGSHLSGIHFELTGEPVTECTGGAGNLTATDLSRDYRSTCDPRLNYAQSLEMAFLISKLLKAASGR